MGNTIFIFCAGVCGKNIVIIFNIVKYFRSLFHELFSSVFGGVLVKIWYSFTICFAHIFNDALCELVDLVLSNLL